jgi:hypothetical protein
VATIDPTASPEQAREQDLQRGNRPSWWGADLDPARRPGRLRVRDPKPFPNARIPPERQPGEPASPMHDRSGKTIPPVFGTAVPLRGLSGAIRRAAYGFPDHHPSHWVLLMLGDRVESMGRRTRRLVAITGSLVIVGAALRLLRR